MHRLAGRGEPVAHSSTPGEYSWCPSPSGGWSRREEEGIYGEEGSYRVVSISSVIDNANTALWCAWYVVRARDALETAGAPRPRASARDSKPREGRKVKSDEERLASERKRKKKKEREREGGRERERESGTARDNVNVCVVAPKHSQNGPETECLQVVQEEWIRVEGT